MPYGDRRLYGVCVRREGHVPLRRRAPAASPATPRSRASRDNALLKLAPVITRLGERRAGFDVVEEAAARSLAALGEDPDDPATAVANVRASRAAARAAGGRRRCASRSRRRSSRAGEKINVIPARAELRVDCRVPPGMGGRRRCARVREVIGDDDGLRGRVHSKQVDRQPLAASTRR